MVLQHNLDAMNNQRMLGIAAGQTGVLAERLSSGYRINRSADDAAGLAISEKMRKQIRGLTQAAYNAQDGISLCQTAEGALNEVQDMLQRANVLAIQAANGTNSDSDRAHLQAEVSQLVREIDRVAVTTKFNETYLLDGSCSGRTMEELEHEQRYISVHSSATFLSADNTRLNVVIHEVQTAQEAANINGETSEVDDALAKVLREEIVPNAVEAVMNTFPDTFDYLKGSDIGIGLYLYRQQSSTLAAVAVAYPITAGVDTLYYSLRVNLANLGNINDARERESLERTIGHEMMHAMMDEAHTAGMVGMTNGGVKDTDYEFPSWFTEGTAQTLSGGYAADNNWVVNGLGIRTGTTEAQIQQILADPAHSLNSGSTSSQYGTGYLAVMYLGHLASGGGNTIDGGSIAAGLDALMNDIRGGKSLSQAISERIGYADIADFEASFAADAAGFVRRLSQAVGAGSGSLIPGMLTKQDVIDATLQDASLSRLFHLDSSTVYVKNTYPANYPVMTGGLADIAGVRGPDYRPSGNLRDEEWMAAMGGPRSSRRELTLHIGADSAMDNAVTLRIEAMNSRTLGITGLDIRTVEEATRSIDTIADALQKVSRQRSAIGAYQNRLEHTVANLDNVVENTTASESRIRDTDMAGTMVGYTNHQIVLQAAQAMLAQSSKSNQGVLTLIGG